MVEKKPPTNPFIVSIGLNKRNSDADQVSIIENEFREAVRAHARDVNLMHEAWDVYFAINGGQWDKSKLIKLRAELREPRTYDITSPKVDALTGSLVSELPDIDWTPIEGQRTAATEAIKDSWYTDKDLTNSDYELMLTIRDGLVHCGWIQLVETAKFGKPTIGFQRIMPGFFIPSAYWIQESDRMMDIGFKIGYLTPEQIKFKYKAKESEIDEAIRIIQKRGHEELPLNAYDLRRQYVGRIADQYQIVEKHYLDHVETTRLIGARVETDPSTGEPTGHIRWVPFPVTKNRDTLEHYAAVNQIEWDTVEEAPYADVVHNVTTVIPDFDRSIVLEDAKSKIQPKGLPFYKFTVSRFNGRNKGIVAALIDPQRTINERESLVTELISKANGGSDIIDDNIFKDDKDRNKFKANANKPGYKHFADLSQSKSGIPIFQVGSNQYPAQVLDQIGRMYDRVIPVTSRVSDSMSSVTESGKSGVLFEKEITANRVANLILNKGIKNLLSNMADGYFYQWQIANLGIQREVTSRDGKRKTLLNERFTDSTGKEMIRNAVGHVQRCRVITTESVNTPTNQMRYRLIYGELLKEINPETNPEHFNFMFTQFMSTMDLPDKVKAELEALNRSLETKTKMQHVQQLMTIHAGTKMAALESANADMQLTAILQQMQASGQAQSQPAVPDQITDATDDVVQPAGPEEEPPPAAGSDIAEGSI